jgi:hypothetical protein
MMQYELLLIPDNICMILYINDFQGETHFYRFIELICSGVERSDQPGKRVT